MAPFSPMFASHYRLRWRATERGERAEKPLCMVFLQAMTFEMLTNEPPWALNRRIT